MAELKFPMVSLNNSLFALFGLEIEIWQIAIVGVLIVALIACLVVAAIRSGKKRKIRIRKYIENEEKAISLRKRLRAVNEDISRIIFDYASKKKALNAQLKKVNDDYRVEHGREDSEYLVQSDKLLKLNEKLRDISLRLKKKGLKPNDEKTLRTELADAEAEHDELSEKIAAMREAKSARDAELKSKTEVIEKELALRKENYDADLAEKNGEKAKIDDELEKLASSQVKIGVKDAEAILEEFRVADDADREIRLNQTREDVERAKNEYLEAVERRAQFERERADAVASAKEDAKRKLALEKAQAETEAKVGYIIAEPAQNVEQPDEEATEINEHAGEEETVGLTEETTLEPAADEPAANEAAEEKAEENNETAATAPVTDEAAEEPIADEAATTKPAAEENDASAALENLENAISDEDRKHSEELIAEVEEVEEAAAISEAEAEAAEAEEAETAAVTADETAATETIGTTATEEIAATETVEIAEEVTETNEPAEEAAIEPIEEAAEPATTEETEETATDGVKPATNDEKIIRMPKVIYNDGIPATPIHKKSKYAKPITKLLVKKPVVKEEPEQNVQAKEEARKSAYLGKWKVEKTEDGKLFAKLRASNGGILLTTPVYTSEIGLKNGINAIKKSLAADNVTVTANKAGKFVFKITAPSGRTIVTSEQYAAKFQCEKALDSAKRFAETAVISE